MYNLILFIQGVENLLPTNVKYAQCLTSQYFTWILFVPVQTCKYICIYGKIPFEDVHKFSGHFGFAALGREAK